MKSEPNLQVLEEVGFIKVKLGVKATSRRRQRMTPTRRQADATVASQSRVETEAETETEQASGLRRPLIGPRVCPQAAKHAWCDGRVHVPTFLHDEFARTAPRGFQLQTWYGGVDLEWGDKPIGDDPLTFWRARWREHHGTTELSKSELRQKANKRAGDEWLARHKATT